MQPPPATHYNNENKKPIDAFFTTLRGDFQCGYFAVDEGLPGDHRTLWIDIPFAVAFGHNSPNLATKDTDMMPVIDPRIRKRYNRRVIKEFKKEDVIFKAAALRALVAGDAPIQQIEKMHEEVYTLNFRIRRKVIKHLRKKRMGQVPWSPKYQKLRDERKLWTVMVKKIGRQIGI